MPGGLHAFLVSIFKMISWRPIISISTAPILRFFSPDGRYLSIDDRTVFFLSILKGQTNCGGVSPKNLDYCTGIPKRI